MRNKSGGPGAGAGSGVPGAGPLGNLLTGEELRIVRAVRAQYARRGGFVRIFPSQNSWQKYSQYLGKGGTEWTYMLASPQNIVADVFVIRLFDRYRYKNRSSPPFLRSNQSLNSIFKITLMEIKVEIVMKRRSIILFNCETC